MHALMPLIALLAERVWGYPLTLFKTIGHPVMWFGKLIDLCDRRMNRPEKDGRLRRDAGTTALLLLAIATLFFTILILEVTSKIPFGWILDGLIASTLLAQKELGRAVRAVADALDISLPAARAEVSHIVGRDPEQLDEAGVSRAAIETLAENASDGIIAPLFWLMIFGLPGIALYKAINTADSMIGHLNDKYRDFGWASAKLDDVVNWIPARICGGLFVLACFLVPKASPTGAWRAMRDDAKKHASPNAGWPEAAMAGALGFALGGPRAYHGEVVDLPRMGSGRAELDARDIRRALSLYWAMLNIATVIVVLITLWRL